MMVVNVVSKRTSKLPSVVSFLDLFGLHDLLCMLFPCYLVHSSLVHSFHMEKCPCVGDMGGWELAMMIALAL